MLFNSCKAAAGGGGGGAGRQWSCKEKKLASQEEFRGTGNSRKQASTYLASRQPTHANPLSNLTSPSLPVALLQDRHRARTSSGGPFPSTKPPGTPPIETAMAARVLLQRVTGPSLSILDLVFPPETSPSSSCLSSVAPCPTKANIALPQRAAPVTAALLVGGIAFYPSVAHAEAPTSNHTVRTTSPLSSPAPPSPYLSSSACSAALPPSHMAPPPAIP